MELLLVALTVINALLLVAVLLVMLIRRASTTGGAKELREDLRVQRGELADALRRDREERVAGERELIDQLHSLRRENDGKLEKIRESVDDKLRESIATSLQGNAERIEALTTSNAAKHVELQSSVRVELEKVRETMTTSLQTNAERIEALTATNSAKHVELQAVLRDELDKLRTGNETKLEKMRETVDEKLQGTLEKRLGESFTLVSTRLEEVQKGLGEMQTLATDVGGLKRVLTNVKNRGGWGEVQLSRQLEDILTPDQYAENVAVRPGSSERVEFAIALPGRDDSGSVVHLPIDSKFPQEDYERLLDAHEAGDKAGVDDASKRLERALLEQAKTIAKKYIEPPHTTEFAILYLPTEGLFAEVQRMPGLTSRLSNELRISIAGPSTLMALLNSLQMGFRTLAIEKRSSEVWQVLAAAKSEFQKYGQVWDKLDKQLATAQNTVREAGVRTRAVERKLRSVESHATEGVDETHDLETVVGQHVNDFDAVNSLPGVTRDEIGDLVTTASEDEPDTRTA